MIVTDTNNCLLVPPPDQFGITLHPRSITARVSPYSAIREQTFRAWKYIQESAKDPMINCGLRPSDMYVRMDMYDSYGKQVDDLIVYDLIENDNVHFGLIVEQSSKSKEFSYELQTMPHRVLGETIDVDVLTFTKSPCKQNNADLLKFRGRVIYSLEFKLCSDKTFSMY
jgi:hypothetical protein